MMKNSGQQVDLFLMPNEHIVATIHEIKDHRVFLMLDNEQIISISALQFAEGLTRARSIRSIREGGEHGA
jgi:hypothetical protein